MHGAQNASDKNCENFGALQIKPYLEHCNRTCFVYEIVTSCNLMVMGLHLFEYILLIFTGLKHIHVTCDGCKEDPLIGTRWNCADCENYDLCSTCFTSDVHDKQHAFLRIDQPQGDGQVHT